MGVAVGTLVAVGDAVLDGEGDGLGVKVGMDVVVTSSTVTSDAGGGAAQAVNRKKQNDEDDVLVLFHETTPVMAQNRYQATAQSHCLRQSSQVYHFYPRALSTKSSRRHIEGQHPE